MEKDRKARILAIVAVFVALIAVGIGFATFSQQLTIAGTADVKASKWEIKFSNLREVSLTGEAEEVTAPTINNDDTTISDYKVNLKVPGDTAVYTFDVVNGGTFDAKITSLTGPFQPTCTGSGDNAEADQKNVCDNVTYTLTYANGDTVQEDDSLSVGETRTMKLTLTYSSTVAADKLPTNDVALSNLGISIVYSQN